MKTTEVVHLQVQLEVNSREKGIAGLMNEIYGINKAGNSMAEAFNRIAESLQALCQWDMSGLTMSLERVAKSAETIEEQFSTQPDGILWTDTLSQISDLCTILQTLISLYSALSVVKIASKIEDLAIIALYAVDYAKVFGTMVGQLATSTGAWIANTAAKAANTAAQWAQIAAATAWQGICAAATAVTTAFGAAMNFLTSPIGLVVLGIAALIAIIVLLIANWDTVKAAVLTAWEAVKSALATAAEWMNTNVLQPIVGFFTEAMDWISAKVKAGFSFIQGIFAGVNEFLQGVFAKDWTEQFGAFGNVLNAFFANVENIWNAIKSIFSGIISFVKNVFAGDWGAAWNSIVDVFKGIWGYLVSIVKWPINGIIGLINGMVQGIVDGINLVIKALNGLSFDIPDWVPVIGGATFGFDLAPLKAPQIPYLAKGAVLPANKPFLAVVGDQKHGTNIEAPLATIQEAVALVMEDQFAGMMAGFEASVSVQKQILQAVLGIEIGDTTIGQATARYNHKMAIIKGGM